MNQLRDMAQEEEAFGVVFRRFNRFGIEVLYLEPEDNGRITSIYRKLKNSFGPPSDQYPFVPHLTIAYRPDLDLNRIQEEMEEKLGGQFPIIERAQSISVFYGRIGGDWRRVEEFKFGS